MGSSNTRPKLTQVVPSHSPVERGCSRGERRIGHTASHWTIEPFQSPPGEPHGILGRRRTTQLPPLKQEVPLTFTPLTAGSPATGPARIWHSARGPGERGVERWGCPPSFALSQGGRCGTSSLPQRGRDSCWGAPGAGVAVPVELITAPLEWKEGAGRTHHCPTLGSRFRGGVLEAQVVLGRQAHSQRRAHRRRVRDLQEQREKRRQGRTVFTGSDPQNSAAFNVSSDGGDDGSGAHRVHLVKRPARRDIFWDVSSEEGLDPRDPSRASPGSPERDSGRTPLTESRNAVGFEEPARGEAEARDDARFAARRGESSSAAKEREERRDGRRRHARPGARVTEKRLPWILGGEGVERGGRRASGNGEEAPEWDGRSGWAISTRREERLDPGKNGSSTSEEEWEFGPQTGGGRRRKGRLTRTKLDLIPSFQNQLDLDSDT
ncbi:hypothetical protein AAFF_G00099820 [Aldrovandia affinis]|uniref:Uncharacterized protein n=1 Tax=Aldrovandia affinis TaxID=143900 RepID=A0AAD7RV63_9TELE|nr:hypothetical protein AAFF_G00099820 [Aldrovandia affinis]